MKRLYNEIIAEHFRENRQMAFVSGPRQVGKTTLAKSVSDIYTTWDNQRDRSKIIQGPDKIAEFLKLNELLSNKPIITFDEIPKRAVG